MTLNNLSFGGKPLLLEIYMHHINSLEKNIDRRYSSNKFNLSIISALGISYSFARTLPKLPDDYPIQSIELVILSVGLLVSVVWMLQIFRFRKISAVKYDVAIQVEEELGISCLRLEQEQYKKQNIIFSFTILEILMPFTVMLICGLMIFVSP